MKHVILCIQLIFVMIFIAATETKNILVKISNFISDTYQTRFDLSLFDIDLSCGGAITNVEVNYNGLNEEWIAYNTIIGPNIYRFIRNTFMAPISARITRTLYSVDDIINATDIISYLPNSNATFDFSSNFCVDFEKPYVWYTNSELQLSYLYHPKCFKFTKNASITLCRDTYNADGVASVPTIDHWEFIQSIVKTTPVNGASVSCNTPKMVAVGADFNETLCNMTSKRLSYRYWNRDTFNASIFVWSDNQAIDCKSQPYLHFKWDRYQMDDASTKWRMGVICYKNTPSAHGTTLDVASQSTSTNAYVESTFASIATITTLDTVYINRGNESNAVLFVVLAISGPIILIVGLLLVLFARKYYLKQKNIVRIPEDIQDNVEMKYTVEGPQNNGVDIKSDKSEANNADVQEVIGDDEFEVIGDDEVIEGHVCVTASSK